MRRDRYTTCCYTSTYPKDTIANYVFDKDSQVVLNIDYQMVKKKLAFMITKTFLYFVTLINVD